MFKQLTFILSASLIVISMCTGHAAGARLEAGPIMTMPGGMTQPTMPMPPDLTCLGNCLLNSTSPSTSLALQQCAGKCNVDLN